MRDIGIVRAVRDPQLFEAYDHFGGGVASLAIGDWGWCETSSAAGTNTRQASVLDHPGILRLVTGATSTNNKRLHLGNAANDPTFTPANFDRFQWVVRIPTITTLTVRLGLMQDVSAASGGTAGAYFQFDPAVASTWGMVTRQGGTQTINQAVTVTANNWYLLEAIRHLSGDWEFRINGTTRFTHSANQPTTACAFGVLCQTGAAAARNIDLDMCYCRAVLGQLFT